MFKSHYVTPFKLLSLVNFSANFDKVLSVKKHANLMSVYFSVLLLDLGAAHCYRYFQAVWTRGVYLSPQISDSPNFLWVWNLLVYFIAYPHLLLLNPDWWQIKYSFGLTEWFQPNCSTQDGRVRIKHLDIIFRASGRLIRDLFLKPVSLLSLPC